MTSTIDKTYLKELLIERPVTVEFQKKDGSMRKMYCTLNSTYIPAEHVPKGVAKPRSEEATTLSVFDIESGGWRSFRYDSVESVTFVTDNKKV